MLYPFSFFQMCRSMLRATLIMVHKFIRKCESRRRGILLDIRTSTGGAVRTHKETNDGRGKKGEGVYVFTVQN